MTVKSRIRQYQQDSESEEEDTPAPAYSSRAALTEAFGSKKSKKAVATIAENRLLAG
ncbi:RNA polymerase I associated factor, A49-like, partial [Lasallia pustulata]